MDSIDLSKYGHSYSPFKRSLTFVESVENVDVYSIGEDCEYFRIGYDHSNPPIIDFIDFDGGPFIKVGRSMNINNNKYIIDKFTYEDNFTKIKVHLRKCNS